MKPTISPSLVLFLLLFPCLAAAAPGTAMTRYDEALALLEEQRFEAAAALLDEAVAHAPVPRLATDGETLDYLPWVNLAAARYELGDVDAARAALEASARHGVATRSYVGRQLWDHYALRIMATGPAASPADDEQTYRDFERQAFTLSATEAAEIERQVLRRCALTGKGPSDRLPWYFHYEYGLELLEAGDPQRAVDELILAANKREESTRGKRMYGMWFTNYLPYYRIALAHSQLGNWRCAMDAMRLSARYGEFSPTDRGFQDYTDLQKLIMRQNDSTRGS